MIKHHKLSMGWAFLAGLGGIPFILFSMWLIRLYMGVVFGSLYYGHTTNFGVFILALVKTLAVAGWFVSRWLAVNLTME